MWLVARLGSRPMSQSHGRKLYKAFPCFYIFIHNCVHKYKGNERITFSKQWIESITSAILRLLVLFINWLVHRALLYLHCKDIKDILQNLQFIIFILLASLLCVLMYSVWYFFKNISTVNCNLLIVHYKTQYWQQNQYMTGIVLIVVLSKLHQCLELYYIISSSISHEVLPCITYSM